MKQGLKLSARALGTYLVAMLISMLVLSSIGPDWYWVCVALNVLLLAGMAFVMYVDGGTQGEHAATMTATVLRMREEGREATPELQKKCFSWRAALVGYLVCMLPLMLVAVANLVAEPYYPPVIIEEAQLIETEPEGAEVVEPEVAIEADVAEGAPVSTDEPAGEPIRVNFFSVVARVLFLPVLAAYQLFLHDPHGLNLVFLFVALLVPLPEALGYRAGQRLRREKLAAIEKGKRRKMRNLKVNKRARTPRAPKHEV